MRTALRSIHIAGILSALSLALLGASGCSLLMLGNLGAGAPGAGPGDEDAETILHSAAQLTLAWDAPASEVAAYRLFYRSHGSPTWLLLEEVPASPSPEWTIEHAQLGDGEFDFGVVAVAADAAQSQMHTSLDATAQPQCGWYLCWLN